MKKITFNMLMVIMVMTVSCSTTDNGDKRNPLINDNSFTNYVPWWSSNTLSSGEGATNATDTKIIIIP